MALIETLTDNFNDNSIDAAKWTKSETLGGTVSEANGEIEIALPSSSGSECQLNSANTYDLTGSSATIKIIDACLPNSILTQLMFRIDTNNKIYWEIDAGVPTITAYKVVGGTTISLASATYVDTTHIYLKIRESSGTVYWDYSTNGVSWTNFASETVANLFAITAIPVRLTGKTGSGTTRTVKVDDFNILPYNVKGVSNGAISKINGVNRGRILHINGV